MFSVASVFCLVICLFVCQHDNFRMSKHRMIKLGGIGALYKNLGGDRTWGP